MHPVDIIMNSPKNPRPTQPKENEAIRIILAPLFFHTAIFFSFVGWDFGFM